MEKEQSDQPGDERLQQNDMDGSINDGMRAFVLESKQLTFKARMQNKFAPQQVLAHPAPVEREQARTLSDHPNMLRQLAHTVTLIRHTSLFHEGQ
jgi:hypothetical protein